MPTYLYRAYELTTRGASEGAVEADDARSARTMLRARGFIPLSLDPVEERAIERHHWYQNLIAALTYRKVKIAELLQFTQQLSSLLKAGLPLIESLAILDEQVSNPTLQEALEAVRKDLLSGVGFSDALAKHPKVFNALYTSLVQAGEISGTLDTMMDRLAQILEANLELQRKIVSALTYPALVLTTLLGIVTLMLVFVVPIFAKLYEGKAQLPLPTLALMALSNNMRTHGLLYFVFLALIVIGIRLWYRTPSGKYLLDHAVLKFPVLGTLVRDQMVNRFVKAFGTVFGAGVTIPNALASCRQLIPNVVLDEVLDHAAESIRNGQSLSKPLLESPEFPRIIAQMIAVGEASGNLEAMMENAAEFSRREIEHRIRRLTTMMEPILTVVIGVVVLIIALALYLPLFDLSKVMMKG